MGICWYCHWGWAKPVMEIYQEACKRLEDGDGWALQFGPSHIVWSDENFDTHSIEVCLKWSEEEESKSERTPEELEVIRWSLEEMLKLPEEIRDPQPQEYDEEHPAQFPPTVEMIRK